MIALDEEENENDGFIDVQLPIELHSTEAIFIAYDFVHLKVREREGV